MARFGNLVWYLVFGSLTILSQVLVFRTSVVFHIDQSFVTNKKCSMNGWMDGFVFFLFFFWLRSRSIENGGEGRRLNFASILDFLLRFTFLDLKQEPFL